MHSRREFLTLLLAGVLLPWEGWAGERASHGMVYSGDVRVLFGWFRYHIDGSLEERIDRPGGTYSLFASGGGEGIAHQIESRGLIRDGRFWPIATRGFFRVRGRDSRVSIDYDYDRLRVKYHHVSHTFFWGRRRTADDVLVFQAGLKIDDLATAYLNYVEGKMPLDAQGFHLTHIIRRARAETEGVDEVQPGGYRAQIVPLRFKVETDPATSNAVAMVDLTRFSSWASSGRPAQISLRPDRRLHSVEAQLILGAEVRILFTPARP